jgi:hypothetical protein
VAAETGFNHAEVLPSPGDFVVLLSLSERNEVRVFNVVRSSATRTATIRRMSIRAFDLTGRLAKRK